MPRTLLVYDDEPNVLQMVSMVARQEGFETVEAQNDEDFWSCYDDRQPSAILLDIVVPGTSGIEMLGQLAGKKCSTPILMMSGYHREILGSARRLGGSYGLDVRDILVKPFSVDDLKSKLREIE
ncbi:MAG: response regulator [Alphaproteobacteria bacterium]|nr:response regulator [Alphaproteobacteria bacterium]